MTVEEAIQLGFEPVSHFTVMNVHTFDLGRGKKLSFGNIGSTNEMIFIQEKALGANHIADTVCIHNFDHNGYMTKERLGELLKWFRTPKQ